MLVGIVGTCVLANTPQVTNAGVLVSGLLGVAGLVMFWLGSRIKVVDFRGNYAWIEGFGDPYIVQLPPFQEEADAIARRAAAAIEQIPSVGDASESPASELRKLKRS